MSEALAEQRGKKGAGLRFLTETVTSPTLASQIRGVLAEFPLRAGINTNRRERTRRGRERGWRSARRSIPTISLRRPM